MLFKFECTLFSPSMVMEKFPRHIVVWSGFYDFLVCRISFQVLLSFRDCIEKSVVILIGLHLYVTFFPSQFLIVFLCFVCLVFLVILWWEDFFFWSILFSVLYASCILIDIFFYRLGRLLWFCGKHFLGLWVGFLLLSLILIFLGLIFS